MAQQAGMNIAIALQPKKKLKIYSRLTFKTLKEKLNTVYKDGIYFLHSSYCDNKVVIELAETSPCFKSNLYVFTEITTNNSLIKKWILGETLIIPTK